MDDLSTELAHMLRLMERYPDAWKAELWRKAKSMAAEYPELYSELPSRLESAVESLQRQRSESAQKPAEPLPTALPAGKPVPTLTNRKRAASGSRASSLLGEG